MQSIQKQDLEDLIREARAGRKQSFSKLIEGFYTTVVCYLIGRGCSPQDAEDIAQESFILAYSKLDQYKGTGTFLGWVLRISRNLLIDKIRKEKTRLPVAGSDAIDYLAVEHNTPETLMISQETVEETYEKLPPRDRLLLDLKVFQRLSYTEISEIMEMPEVTIRVAFYRLINRLKL